MKTCRVNVMCSTEFNESLEIIQKHYVCTIREALNIVLKHAKDHVPEYYEIENSGRRILTVDKKHKGLFIGKSNVWLFIQHGTIAYSERLLEVVKFAQELDVVLL